MVQAHAGAGFSSPASGRGDAPEWSAPTHPLQRLLVQAAAMGASHLHFDPLPEGRAELWFRVGRARIASERLSPEEADMLRSALLVAAGIAGDEAGPKRGWFHSGGDRIAVAVLPVATGPRIVLTRGARSAGDERLRALGMPDPMAADVQQALAGGGLILVAAPPGAGRSTSLRALLTLAADPARPALAIDLPEGEPVPGAYAVSASAGCDSAALSRSGLEQDFDILLIDSIDGRDSARAAVEAAGAGRLVLAGIEAPNAVGALARLRAWRVEAFRLASSLSMVVAQRLVRRLCPACREPVQAQGSTSALLGFDPGAIVYAPHGCASCGGTGFVGQTGVFEAIRANADIRRLINDGGDEAILARHAFVSAANLGSAARALARSGVTTPEEAVTISRG